MFRSLLLVALSMVLGITAVAADKVFGAAPALKETTPIATLLSSPDAFVGKKVQVKGRITEVCQMMGCWMNLVDDASGKAIRIKVNDGEIVFPKDASGKQAVAEGVFSKIELTRQQAIGQAKHEAEEQGRKFNPDSIKSGKVIYQIQGTGARLMGL